MFKSNNIAPQKPKFHISAHKIGIYQEGGEMVMGEPAAESEDPMMQLAAMATDALEAQDANLAMQVCQMIVEMTSGEPAVEEEMVEGMEGQPPVEGQPAQEAPPMAQGGMYKKGGTIPKKISEFTDLSGEYEEVIF